MLRVYDTTFRIFSSSAGTVFMHQNLPSTDARFWRIKTVPALKGIISPAINHLSFLATFCLQSTILTKVLLQVKYNVTCVSIVIVCRPGPSASLTFSGVCFSITIGCIESNVADSFPPAMRCVKGSRCVAISSRRPVMAQMARVLYKPGCRNATLRDTMKYAWRSGLPITCPAGLVVALVLSWRLPVARPRSCQSASGGAVFGEGLRGFP